MNVLTVSVLAIFFATVMEHASLLDPLIVVEQLALVPALHLVVMFVLHKPIFAGGAQRPENASRTPKPQVVLVRLLNVLLPKPSMVEVSLVELFLEYFSLV